MSHMTYRVLAGVAAAALAAGLLTGALPMGASAAPTTQQASR